MQTLDHTDGETRLLAGAGAGSWLAQPTHRAWARGQALRLFTFFRATVDDVGRFVELDDHGAPLRQQPVGRQSLLTVARTVHCYALGELLGVPGGAAIVRRGLQTLWEDHRDPAHGGYFDAVDLDGDGDTTKTAYGQAHVLLAACAARAAGHADAERLLRDALAVIDAHFWRESEGASAEDHDREWHELEDYRGANSNMHLCEALLAAAEVTGDPTPAARADAIARTFIDGHARANGWLLPEHYDSSWRALREYNRDAIDDPFRPYGATVGHSLEWARLVVGCARATGAGEDSWHLGAAEALFARGVEVGWDTEHTGLAYTVDWDGRPANPDHYWWPIAEGIQTSATLLRLTGHPDYERWYRRFWEFSAAHLIDEVRGGWHPELTPDNRPKVHPWYGKPDLYHSLQACLAPLLPAAPSLVGAVRLAGGSAD